MADRAEIVTSSKQTVVTPAVEKKYLTFEATVSKDDTVTLGDLAEILGAALFKKSDGATVDFTFDDNVLTITEDPCSNVPVVGFAYGT